MKNGWLDERVVREGLRRVLNSEIFLRSPRLSEFLAYIVEHALSNPASGDLKEYSIGVEVFHRASTFDPADHSLVRRNATRLRQELERYYAGPGRHDPVIIALPRGGYRPVFHLRGVMPEGKLRPAVSRRDALRFFGEGCDILHRNYGRSYWLALKYFNLALKADPSLTEAYFHISDCYLRLSEFGLLPGHKALEAALPSVNRCLEAVPGSSEAYSTRGALRAVLEHNWQAAADDFRAALELSDDSGFAMARCAVYLMRPTGHLEEAESQLLQAADVEPGNPLWDMHMAMVLHSLRKFDEMLELCARGLEWAPDFLGLKYWMGRAFWAKNMTNEAIEIFEKVADESGLPTARGALGYCYARTGRKEEARVILEELIGACAEGYVPHIALAVVYLGLGQLEPLYRSLDLALQDREPSLPALLNVDPLFDELRSRPRIVGLLKAMHLR